MAPVRTAARYNPLPFLMQIVVMPVSMFESQLDLPLVARGKVRDIYAVDDENMLIVTTDRLSAFDVILPDPVPGKGRVLTTVSNFWFGRTRGLIANHLTERPLSDVVSDPRQREQVEGRAIIVRRMRALPVEAIVRGFIIGSGWKDYQNTGTVCGIGLPAGLQLADELPEPIYTPSTKAEVGGHDENVSFDTTCDLIGEEFATQIRDVSLKIYAEAARYARERGIIIADTKFEFGLDENDDLVLIDEVLTPDSSRFWPADSYRPGSSPASFDKQYVRDYLESLDWDKKPPAPHLPPEVLEKTAAKYREAQRLLTGR